MGKGDKKTRRGKVTAGSYGKTRPRKSGTSKVAAPKVEAKVEKLAKLLDTDIEEIKKEIPPSTKNENCTFNDNSIGINYVNIPEDLLDTVLKYNRKLEEEVLHLKQQISK